MATRGCGKGRVGKQCVVYSGYRVSVGDDENTLEIGGVDGHTVTRTYLVLLSVHFSMVKMVNFVLCIFYYN